MAPSSEAQAPDFDMNQFTCIDVKDVEASERTTSALDSMTLDELKSTCSAAATTFEPRQHHTATTANSPLSVASKLHATAADGDDVHQWMCKLTSSLAQASENHASGGTSELRSPSSNGTSSTSTIEQLPASLQAQTILNEFDVARHRPKLPLSTDDHGEACREAFLEVLAKYGKKQ